MLGDLGANVAAIFCAGDDTIQPANCRQNHGRAGLQRDNPLWGMVRRHDKPILHKDLESSGGDGCLRFPPTCRHVTILQMYSPQLLDHFEHPRNPGEVADPDATAQLENPACGDILKLTIKVANGYIAEIRFLAKGCVPAMACGSALTELVKGTTMQAASRLRCEELVLAVGGLPEASTHASHLAMDALAAALKQLKT
jgi:nitrogen fixation protein NifU and related proteins